MITKWKIPENWHWSKLEDVIEDTRGGTWGTADDPEGTIVLRPNNIGFNGEAVFENLRYREVPTSQLEKQALANGDVFLTKSNSLEQVGRCAYFVHPNDGRNYVASNFLQKISFDRGKVYPKYAFYYLYSGNTRTFFQSKAKGSSASLKNLSVTHIRSLPIPIPFPDELERSLAEQRRIVARIEALLAEVREMRKLHGEITADTDALMDAIRGEKFFRGTSLPEGWEARRIDSFAEVNPRRPQITRDDNALTSFVPMANVDEVRGEFSEIESKPYGEVRRGFTYFEENDVVFAKITPSMQNGKSAVARNLIDGFGFGTTEFHVIRSNGSVLPDWIHQFVRQKYFLREAMSHFRGAVGQQRVPPEFLAEYEIPVPFPNDREKSLEIQTSVINHMQIMQAEIWQMQIDSESEKELLEDIEQAILAQAFRGEL